MRHNICDLCVSQFEIIGEQSEPNLVVQCTGYFWYIYIYIYLYLYLYIYYRAMPYRNF